MYISWLINLLEPTKNHTVM